MNRLVVDASIVVKWYLNEPGSGEARAVVDEPSATLLAPDLVVAEVAQVLWKQWPRLALEPMDAERILRSLRSAPITLLPAEHLILDAWRLATATGTTAYDSLYLAAATLHEALLLTADRSLGQRAVAAGIPVRIVGDSSDRWSTALAEPQP